jgi:hypothetical protein
MANCQWFFALPFSSGNWNCSTEDLSETRSLQNNETAHHKGVHYYVVNTLNVFCKGNVLYELMLPIGHVPTHIYVNKTYIPHYNLAIIYITQLLVCNKMHQQNINQQQIRQNNCTRHSEWLELPFSCGNRSCSIQDLSVCSYKGKSQCKKSCVCAEQNLAWTDLCSCHGSESCKNVHSYTLAEDV